MSDCYESFNKLVHDALKNENFKGYEFTISGGNEKGEGYIGDITFVDVLAQKSDGSYVTCNLVLKVGGKNKTLRSIVRLGFEREIHIYDKVMPAFRRLQLEHNMTPFKAVPRCYSTLLTSNEEALVLENMKSKGYQLYNRKTVMNMEHITLALKNLAQWHALSFALKFKKPKVFESLTTNWKCPATEIFVKSHVGKWLNQAQEHLFDVLKDNDEMELLERYKEKINNKAATSVIADILDTKESQKVITHGDCWNNNFMFKYQENSTNELVPLEVAFLDFQISTVSSPVIDLSYFIYAVSSADELKHFEQMLLEYHRHLSEYLAEMQCDPNIIFSFSSLKSHWKKYAAYGALIQPMTVCDALVDKDDAASYGDLHENYEYIIGRVSKKENEAFTSRLIAVARHFASYN